MPPSLRLPLWILTLFLGLLQTGWGSWQYTNGSTGTQGGFTYQASVSENSANTFTGTATLTAFSGSSASIPSTVPILITVNTTNSQGEPIQFNESVNCTVLGFSGFTLNSDASFSGDVNIIGNFNLNGSDLTVNGSVIHQSGSLTFGTLPQGSSDPDIRLEITGDYLQQADWDNDGIYEGYCTGRLNMDNSSDIMVVGGNIQFYSNSSSSMSAGTLELKGNFRQKTDTNSYGTSSFSGSGTHRTLLSGTVTQTVTFESPGGSHFNILEVTNPNPLVFQSVVRAQRVKSPAPLTIQSPGEGGICGTLECDIAYTASSFTILTAMDLAGHAVTVNCPIIQLGYLQLNGGHLTTGGDWNQKSTVDMMGGQLSVGGNWIHQSDALALSGGRLQIAGDYLQQRDVDGDGTCETYCSGGLMMYDAADYMFVGGSVQFWSTYYSNGNSNINCGVLEILGDFHQKQDESGYGNSSYPGTGTHRTLLSGTGTQTVTFKSPGTSYFNILEVTNPHLSVTSVISIANGGSMLLNYLGTDVVGALFLSGTPQPNGLYDSTNTNGLITGTGKIQVGPFTDFTAWSAAIAPGQSTDQDHDHDGVPNGIEYFMGRTGNDFTANPGIAVDGTITWPKSPSFNGSYA